MKAIDLSRASFLKLELRLMSHHCAENQRKKRRQVCVGVFDPRLSVLPWATASVRNGFCLKRGQS